MSFVFGPGYRVFTTITEFYVVVNFQYLLIRRDMNRRILATLVISLILTVESSAQVDSTAPIAWERYKVSYRKISFLPKHRNFLFINDVQTLRYTFLPK
ncbi:MAG: hypothetical protein ABI857_13620 [Acidobacteriota bacterium]